MNTVDRTEAALLLAQQLGYQVRHEWLGGNGGGVCEFSGKKWVFVDLALSSTEQLEQLLEALRDDPRLVQEGESSWLFHTPKAA